MSKIEHGLTDPQMIDLSKLTTRKAERQLFLRLFDYMAKLEPLVPMRHFTCDIGDWKATMLNRQDFGTFSFGAWAIIWEAVDWKRCCSGGGSEYYGANLLQAFGHLGDAVQKFGDVPIDVMLMVMVELQGKRLVLKYSKDQKWLQPTRFGSAQLGVTGGLRLAHTGAVINVPQDLFSYYCRDGSEDA